MTTTILLKRAYDAASPSDGYRIYIDRLWPQGLSHQSFHYDQWDKAVSPSPQLREWFHADPTSRWTDFEKKYTAELQANPEFARLKETVGQHPTVTLLFSSHDREHNNAVVLRGALLLNK